MLVSLLIKEHFTAVESFIEAAKLVKIQNTTYYGELNPTKTSITQHPYHRLKKKRVKSRRKRAIRLYFLALMGKLFLCNLSTVAA